MEEERKGENKAAMVVARLIENATNSTAAEVDPRLLKAIKSVVRYSDSELRLAAQTLMSLMKRDHSQVRYLALLIIDELFMRSKLFRTLLVENLDQLLSLSVGFRRNLPLPAPASVASILRSKAIEFLERWNESFGIHYRQLRLGYDYLKNTLRYQFPNLQANAARIQQERREREMRTNEILVKKFEALKDNLVSIKAEIQSTIEEIGECLRIVKKEDEDMPLAPTDDEEIEEFRNSELRQIRLDSLKEGERVQENTENKVVFDTLRELQRVLLSKHLAAIQEWISILLRVEAADNRFRDSTLKEFIDIRNRIQLVMRKCEELGCTPKIANDEEESIWEEGSLESFTSGRSGTTFCQSNDCTPASTSNDVRSEDLRFSDKKSNGKEKKNHDRSGNESDPLRYKLLDEAPVVKWGSFLNNWGSNQDVLANQRGLDLEGHWGRVDYDAVIPAEKIAELNVQASVYKEDPIEIRPCRAPLRKGGLCQRRDLRVCPFHGLIIPRDDEGKPINLSSSVEEIASQYQQEERTPDLESNTMEQLFNQAVNNVRERDKEETKKREYDKKSLKRAKLAKVREHNESVLRDAALASTSRSAHIGEDKEMLNGSKSSTKNKKQTLSSMLKKKEVAKERLAQRLLNTRASDATIRQLTVAEDANYREAFPNQCRLFSTLVAEKPATARDPIKLVSEHSILGQMETNFSKELEEKWSSLFNRFDRMTMQHIGEDRAMESGLDSHGRLNTSLFYGENTDRWVSEAEKIFSRNRLSEAQKIEAATSCFACETWKWFQEVDQLRPVRTWDELKGLMLARFCVSKLSGEEVSTGRSRSALNWETMITVQRCQLEKITSPSPSPSSEGRSEFAVEGVSVIGLNHKMKKGEANLVNGLADTAEIYMNKQVDLVLELAQTMEDKFSMAQIHLTASGPLRGKPILTPIQANIPLPFQSRYSPPNPHTSPNFFTKIEASAGIRPSINGKERVYPSPSPSSSGEEKEERQIAKLPLQLKAVVRDESEQAWEGRLTQLEVVGMIQCGTEHKINSHSRTHNSEILCTHATGYRVLIDTILVGENSLEHTVACEILPKSDEAAVNLENRKLMMEKMGQAGKEKNLAASLPEQDEIGAITDSHKDHNRRDDSGKAGVRDRQLEVPISEVLAVSLQAKAEVLIEDQLGNGLKPVLKLEDLGFILEMAQLVEGNLLLKPAQGKPSPVCNINLFSSCNRNTSHLSPILITMTFS